MHLFAFFIASLWLTVAASEPGKKPATCPGEDYTPCDCFPLSNENVGQSVVSFLLRIFDKPKTSEIIVNCNNVSIAQVKNVFSRTSARDIKRIKISIAPSETTTIPADLLGTSRTSELRIHCDETSSYQLKIDDNAFTSLRNDIEIIKIKGCDLKKQPNFKFLNGFQKLSQLHIENSKNFNSFQGLPSGLYSLSIENSRGFENVADDPKIPLPGLKMLSLSDNQMGDVAAAKILKIFASSSKGSLTLLDMQSNSLTAIPELVPSFTKLEQLWLEYNDITSIDIQPFAFSGLPSNVHLGSNAISSIKPNVFGDGNFHYIDLEDNKLTRLDSYVFQNLLEIISRREESSRGKIWLNHNPIKCDCHLAWLIVHKRHLLPLITRGKCSNSTSFETLNPEGFRDCPVFTCPDNLDGNFLNPLTCSSYYTCAAGKSALVECPRDRVFNPSKQICDSLNNVTTCK